jgi:steroid 5-alpha reductase family enzyme
MSASALFLLLAAAVSLGMTAVWFTVAKGAGSGWVDTVWSFLVGAASVTATLVPVSGWEGDWHRRLLLAAIATLWSSRLGLHILRRTLRGGEDPRYAKLKEEWGERWRWRLFLFLQIQAAAALLLTTTVFTAARNPAIGWQWSDIAGIAIIVIAVVGEGIADAQLARFRSADANRGKVCDIGLWGLSRHPNYFFQWLGWLGYAIVAIGPAGDWGWGCLALAGPALMYWLLVHVSGIPPLEAHMMRSRGAAFAAYARRVNAFWLGAQKRE